MGTRKKVFYFSTKDKTREPHYHSSGNSSESRHAWEARCVPGSRVTLSGSCRASLTVVVLFVFGGGGVVVGVLFFNIIYFAF